MLLRILSMLILIGLVSCKGDGGVSSNKGNTFYINLGGDPTTINPITSTDAYASNVHSYIFDSLLITDEDSYEWKPWLADKWEISEDKKVFTFYIRKGATFSDGKPVTAEDVKFSFDVIFDEDYKTAHKRPYYEGIEKVEVVDPSTVRFVTKNTYFQNFDVCASMKILAKHFYGNKENKKQFNKKVVGSGPYIIKSYEKGKRFLLEKRKDWWGNQLESLSKYYSFNKISMKFIKERNVSFEMFKKGKFDFIGLDPEYYLKKATGKMWGEKLIKVKVQNKSPKGYSFIGWNMRHPIFKDKKVRKALYHLVNRPLMIEKFEFNFSEPAAGPVYPKSPYFNKEIKLIDYNPQVALKLLKEAGWEDTDGDNILDKVIDGKKTKFSFTILEPWKGFEKYLTVFKEDAKKVGVEVNINILEWNSFIKLVDERKFEAVRLAWTASVDWDPKQIWHSQSMKGGSNFVGLSNPEIDRLIDKARLIYDRAERIKILNKVQKMIVEEYPYVWFNYSKYSLYSHNSRIQKPKDTFNYTIGTKFWKAVE